MSQHKNDKMARQNENALYCNSWYTYNELGVSILRFDNWFISLNTFLPMTVRTKVFLLSAAKCSKSRYKWPNYDQWWQIDRKKVQFVYFSCRVFKQSNKNQQLLTCTNSPRRRGGSTLTNYVAALETEDPKLIYVYVRL